MDAKISSKNKVLFLLVVLAFLLVKLSFVSHRFSDDNLYYYMASQLKDGAVPYSDFFFASPPLQIYLYAFLMFFVGKKLLILKLVPIACTIGTAYIIHKICRKECGEFESVAGPVIFLFSVTVLATTDYSTGVHLSTLFLTGMVYKIRCEKHVHAGFLASLALLTRLYAIFPITGILFYLAYRYLQNKEREVLSNTAWFIISTCLPFLTLALILQIFSDGRFFYDIFYFRLNLVSLTGIPKARIIQFLLKWDLTLIVLTTAFLMAGDKKRFLPELSVAGFLTLFYLAYQDLYLLYFVLIAPCTAIFSASMLGNPGCCMPKKKFLKLAVIFLIILSAHNIFFYTQNHAHVAEITFIDQLVDYVNTESTPSDKLYGSYEITPLVAVLTDREIAGGFADTNDKNFMTGLLTHDTIREEIQGGVRFILAKTYVSPEGSLLSHEHFIDWQLLKACQPAKTYDIESDYSSNTLLVWDCARSGQSGQSAST